ncbi:MAG TPA: outer membrane lipid asymmetry maintenance protein MlaD [Dongiaceae bacterium]
MQRNVLETIMGAVVLLAAIAFLFVIYTAQGVKQASGGYHVVMRLDRGGSITPGTDVRAAGVKVGTVVKQEFDPANFQAVITLDIDGDVKLPTDSSAIVDADGLLGSNYVKLEPGADDTLMKEGDQFKSAQGAVSIVDLINKFVVGGDSSKDSKSN